MSGSDDRDRRRLGDATRQRIEGLADGWKVSTKSRETGEEPEDSAADVDEPARGDKGPPPPEEKAPEPKKKALPTPNGETPRRKPPLPRPSKDSPVLRAGSVPLSSEAERHASTEDASGLIVGVAPTHEPAPRAERLLTDRVVDDEDAHEDPTVLQTLDDEPRRPPAPGTQLRRPAALPRKRGLLGDAKYVFTAFFGVAGARRELATVEKKIAHERESRRERLTQISKHAIADSAISLSPVVFAREKAARIEEIRSRHAGATAAADAAIDRLERERSDESEVVSAEVQSHEEELVDLASRLAPQERESNKAVKKAADIQVTLAALDKKIEHLKTDLDSGKSGRSSPENQEAALAAACAERDAVEEEEPDIAAELDELNPRIANLQAARAETEEKIKEARVRDREGVVRTEEKIVALRARRAVDERAVADADRALDEALAALGEELAIDRPRALGSRLRPVDEHDVSIATLERRALELGEIVGGVSKAAIARGIVVILVFLGAVGAAIWFGKGGF